MEIEDFKKAKEIIDILNSFSDKLVQVKDNLVKEISTDLRNQIEHEIKSSIEKIKSNYIDKMQKTIEIFIDETIPDKKLKEEGDIKEYIEFLIERFNNIERLLIEIINSNKDSILKSDLEHYVKKEYMDELEKKLQNKSVIENEKISKINDEVLLLGKKLSSINSAIDKKIQGLIEQLKNEFSTEIEKKLLVFFDSYSKKFEDKFVDTIKSKLLIDYEKMLNNLKENIENEHIKPINNKIIEFHKMIQEGLNINNKRFSEIEQNVKNLQSSFEKTFVKNENFNSFYQQVNQKLRTLEIEIQNKMAKSDSLVCPNDNKKESFHFNMDVIDNKISNIINEKLKIYKESLNSLNNFLLSIKEKINNHDSILSSFKNQNDSYNKLTFEIKEKFSAEKKSILSYINEEMGKIKIVISNLENEISNLKSSNNTNVEQKLATIEKKIKSFENEFLKRLEIQQDEFQNKIKYLLEKIKDLSKNGGQNV